jgi:hypothetical protein
MMNEAFILGLANGAYCLASCGIVLFPYMLGKQGSIKVSLQVIGTYLSARFITYIIIGYLASLIGKSFFLFDYTWKSIITGGSYIVFSMLLLNNQLLAKKKACKAKESRKFIDQFHLPGEVVPFIWGMVSSINLCPPILLAVTQSASAHMGALKTMVFFSLFFLGTAIYFVPLPFLGFLKKNELLKTVGKLSSILIGIWFFLKGLYIIIQLTFYGTN